MWRRRVPSWFFLIVVDPSWSASDRDLQMLDDGGYVHCPDFEALANINNTTESPCSDISLQSDDSIIEDIQVQLRRLEIRQVNSMYGRTIADL
jgi:hypothetical protein